MDSVIEKKKYLSQAYVIKPHIRELAEELALLRSTLRSIGGGLSGSPGATRYNGDTREVYGAIRCADLEAEIRSELALCEAGWREIRGVIAALEDEREREILRLRYLSRHSFKQISKELYLSERRIYEIHDSALGNIVIPPKSSVVRS